MKTKHTPGPWALDSKIENVFIGHLRMPHTIYPISSLKDADGGSTCTAICILPNEDISVKTIKMVESNAKLISAAPELLEALILANEMLFSVAIDAELANKIELAIKKATE